MKDSRLVGEPRAAESIEGAATARGRVATLADYGVAASDSGTVESGNPCLTATDGGAMVKVTWLSRGVAAAIAADGFQQSGRHCWS
jgi:hypothetical protein